MFGEEVVSGFDQKQGQVVRPNIDSVNIVLDQANYKLNSLALSSV
jgi:hypothetical protein